MKKAHPPVSNPYSQPTHPNDLMTHRSQFMNAIRQFFFDKAFIEVETPIVVPSADPSPHLASFQTTYRGLDEGEGEATFFLHTSPEFAMKRLVAAGYPKIFQICKFFRNGEVSILHNPEFTGLEWYLTEADYNDVMDITEEMVLSFVPSHSLNYQGQSVDLSSPWDRMTVHESIEKYAGYKLPEKIEKKDLEKACRILSLSVTEDDQWDDLFFKIFINYVEPKLGIERPLFLTDYPIQMGALARSKPNHPHIAERVELYIAGLELANGYSELTDANEQRQRWEEEIELRELNKTPHTSSLDEGLLNALAWGMPPTTGIAFGLDRLLMILRDAPTIQDVLPFPLSPPSKA